MNDVIRQLPDSVANQIAAGEVIQRPASVVKELVENSVDAGATEIQVVIKDAGRTLIQVVDNGCGMSVTDARLAFNRHATSKIQSAADLFDLHTMGFRGEALPSICSISQVELRTRRPSDSVGTRILISGEEIESQTPDVCAAGCNIMVRNLFYNIPVRRRYLKKDATEMARIIQEFERLALVNPSVELTLTHNGVTIHHLHPANLKQRIVDLFGKHLDSQLIPVETDTPLVRLSGFIVRPENCRKRGYLQYLFVNGRNMRHPVFHKAIEQCYEGIIDADEQPTYFIDFAVDPTAIDVNVHPTKKEINFEQEQSIRQILYAAVKETLGRFNSAPEIDFSTLTEEYRPEIPAFGSHKPDTSRPARPATDYNPFAQRVENWEELYRNFTSQRQEALSQAEGEQSLINLEEQPACEPAETGEGALLPVGRRYVAMAVPGGMRVIDIHRAHFTVLHQRFSQMLAAGEEVPSQRLLFPESVELDASRHPLMEELEPQLAAAGFDVAPLGQGAWAINAVPLVVDAVNPAELITTIVNEAAEQQSASAAEGIADRVATGMARAAAVRANRTLSEPELQHLVSELMSLAMPGFTPDGLPTFTVIAESDLEKMI